MKDKARAALGATGFGTLVTGIVATFMHEPQAADVALIVIGGGTGAIAILQPVLTSFKIDKSGIEAKFRDAEKDIANGNVVEADKGVKGVDAVLQGTGRLTTEPRISMEARWIPTNFSLAQEAIADLARLSAEDRAAVEEQLPKLDGHDPKAIQPQSGGQSYFVRRIRRDLRIYYRLLAPPDKWIVVAIGK